MTDPGVVAALGLETVEWLDEAGERVTVRVSGRWRRRPTATGQPWLVVEVRGERHRFPAMPEPPGISGTMPGTWRMSFRVPADIARTPSVRAWLQLGAVLVPLPAEPAVESIPPALEPRAVGVHELEEAAMEEQLRDAERALESERARVAAAETAAAELAARVAKLAHDLEQREAEVTRLGATLADRERSLRSVRQRAHAEEMVRLELVRERDRLEDMLAASRQRVRSLEEDLVVLRRRADEAEHLAAAARRAAPPIAAAPPAPARRAAARTRAYAAERSLVRWASAPTVPPPVIRLPPRPGWSDRERELVSLRTWRSVAAAPAEPETAHLAAALEALRGELADVRALAERETEARTAAEALSERLRRQLAEQEARSARAFAALDDLRDQIEWVRQAYASLAEASAPEPAPAALEDAPAAPEDAPEATAEAAPAAPEPAPATPEAAPPTAPSRNGGIEFHRLDAARSRLREQTPALPEQDPTAVPDEDSPRAAEPRAAEPRASEPRATEPRASEPRATESDLRPPFTLAPIAARDPVRAGSLLTEILPAQGLVHPRALAYDLVFDPSTCIRVTVDDGGATDVRWMHTARALEDVGFRLEGEPAAVVRLLTAGALRRRLRRRRLARVRGDRTGLEALRALLNAQLTIAELERAGVRIAALDLDHHAANPATSG